MKTNFTQDRTELHLILMDTPVNVPIRITKKLATQLLLENFSIICGGVVFYLNIFNLGLGVCEVCKAPCGTKCTQLVKKKLYR